MITLSPLSILGSLANISWLYMWRFISGLSVPFHWSVSKFMPEPQCSDYNRFVVVLNQELWCFQHCSSFSWLVWFFGVFCVPYEFEDFFFNLWKMDWNFARECIECTDGFRWNGYLNYVTSSNPWTSISFHLFMF